jgi:hypothetical protein
MVYGSERRKGGLSGKCFLILTLMSEFFFFFNVIFVVIIFIFQIITKKLNIYIYIFPIVYSKICKKLCNIVCVLMHGLIVDTF